MSRIKHLEENILRVKRFVEEDEKRLTIEPDDVFLHISYQSNKYDLEQLYYKLIAEKNKRSVEVLDLRLRGADLNFGSIPLKLLSKISDFFSSAILASSNKFFYGRDRARFSKELQDVIDLRLSGMALGSTRLVVTGKSAPDMFGFSVLEEVLNNFFIVLHAYGNGEPTNLSEAEEGLFNFGQRGVKSLLDFTGILIRDNIEIDLTWDDPSNIIRIWKGDTVRLSKMHAALSSARIEAPKTVDVVGTIKLLSESGRILLNTIDTKTISVKFSPSQYIDVQELTLGRLVSIKCEKQKIFNTSTNNFRDFYSFIEINPAG